MESVLSWGRSLGSAYNWSIPAEGERPEELGKGIAVEWGGLETCETARRCWRGGLIGSIPTRSNGEPNERRRSGACMGVCSVAKSKFPPALKGLEVITPLRGRGIAESWLVAGRWERVEAMGG